MCTKSFKTFRLDSCNSKTKCYGVCATTVLSGHNGLGPHRLELVDSNKQLKHFPGHDKLGMCRTSLVSPKQAQVVCLKLIAVCHVYKTLVLL